ncbi:MAG: hypothetical protein IPM24_08395 [Bryobacterales bacterium]|nr:hypothetical protein [Bryobacterales bacterium]
MWTRRTWLRLAAGFCTGAAQAAPLLIDGWPGARGGAARIRYRANATVTLLNIPLVSRSDVGGGWASASESEGVLRLEFAGGSDPARARGLNRMGFVQEVARASDYAYFGFISASREESFAEAKAALEREAGELTHYIAVQGSAAGGRLQISKKAVAAPSRLTWSQFNDLVSWVRRDFSSDPPELTSAPRDGLPFLQTMWSAMCDGKRETSSLFLHQGQRFQLRTRKTPDPKRSERAIRLEGVIEAEAKREKTPFRLWYVDGTPPGLPFRIEYKARPYLRLVFESIEG